MNVKDWWFGQGFFGKVLYDKSIQPGDDSVYLYVLEEDKVKKYLTSEMKMMLKPETDIEII